MLFLNLYEKESTETMNIQFLKLNIDCSLEITSNSNLENWENQLNVVFKHNEKLSNFNYICGVNQILKEPKTIFCHFEYYDKEKVYKGEYTYDSFTKIGKGNDYSLDNSFSGKKFTYFGLDSFKPLTSNQDYNNYYYFVSEKGSKFSFIYEAAGVDKDMPPILYSIDKIPLTNCKKSIHNDESESKFLAYCEITEDELNLFDLYPSQKEENQMFYGCYCGKINYMNITVFKLDKTKYPILRVKHFIISQYILENSQCIFSLLVDIEGSVSGYDESFTEIAFIVNVETNNVNSKEYNFKYLENDLALSLLSSVLSLPSSSSGGIK